MYQAALFKGKTALVTGGGSGIGFTIAQQLLELGAEVYIGSRKQERLDEAVAKLEKFGTVRAQCLDIRKLEDVSGMADFIEKESGQLDILVNNAGGQFPSAAMDISPNGWNAVINTNLNGTWFVTQEMAKRFFFPQDGGKIINIIANIYRGFPGMAHTGAARAGVANLTKSLSVEWASKKINVNAIAPGVIYSSGLEQYPPSLLKGVTDKIPLRRLGTTDEVGHLTLFLAGPMSDFITGETIYLDGGQRLWGDIWEL